MLLKYEICYNIILPSIHLMSVSLRVFLNKNVNLRNIKGAKS